MSSLVPSTRYFDMRLWTSLQAIQPRTKDNVTNLFFPSVGGIPTTSTPTVGTNRSADLLTSLTDSEYREVYSKAIKSGALEYDLMSKAQFQNFTKFHVPALRSVMEHQVLRWIFPSPKQTKRYAPKSDLASVLKKDLFEKKRFDEPATAAKNLVSMVAKCVFATSNNLRQSSDRRSTAIRQSWSKIHRRTSCEIYKKPTISSASGTNWAWFSLAKMVARFTHYDLKADIMESFNDPAYQVSQIVSPIRGYHAD